MRHQTEWVYKYDDDGRRIGLVQVQPDTPVKIRSVSRPTETDALQDVWTWGNPMHREGDKHKPKSYANALVGRAWNVTRRVTTLRFWTTYREWKELLNKSNSNVELLRDVYKYDLKAQSLDISNTQEYIAGMINRTQQAVSMYQRMLDMDAMSEELSTNYLYIRETSYSISEGRVSDWYPSKKQIERKAASIPRTCAISYDGCRGYTNNGKLAICFPCHVKIKADNTLMPEWAVTEENRIRRAHYDEAVNACFEDHYGTVSIEEAESLLDAA